MKQKIEKARHPNRDVGGPTHAASDLNRAPTLPPEISNALVEFFHRRALHTFSPLW
jgi:hypothetical protein